MHNDPGKFEPMMFCGARELLVSRSHQEFHREMGAISRSILRSEKRSSVEYQRFDMEWKLVRRHRPVSSLAPTVLNTHIVASHDARAIFMSATLMNVIHRFYPNAFNG